MRLAIMQPYFMPYIGYFQAIAAVDKYILYSNLNFIKEAWMNRNRLLMRDGNVVLTTVPLRSKSSYTMIYDVEIDNAQPWKNKFLRTVQMCYSRKPYYEEVYPLIEDLLKPDYTLLKDLNAATIIGLARYLGITTQIESDNSRYLPMEQLLQEIESDYSPLPYLERTRPIRKVARVIEMCRQEGADHFLNAIGGQQLYSKEEFVQYGIRLDFVQTNPISYRQDTKTGEFVPNLSIIDVLMNNGRDATRSLLTQYTIV
ncbi:MAG: WbqC family protein [Bacteroidales bacterium]|nr:WbqC family protein [Bacteroidales bacterium]